MSDPDRFRALMLEHLYGLLEPDEVRELQAYLATPEGAGLRAEAEGWRARIGGAARVEFPGVEFVPPADAKPAHPPVRPAAPKAVTMRAVWTRWGVAASVLLVVFGLGGPAAYQFLGWTAQSQETSAAKAALAARQDQLRKAQAHRQGQRDEHRQRYEQAVAARRAAEDAYHQALADARAALSEKDFLVRLTGPDRAQPGAPNEWQIEALTPAGAPASPKRMELVIRDDRDRVLLRESREDTHGKTALKLPASFWADVRPGARLFLDVAAYADDNRRSLLARRVPLARPVFVTHLVTDKPMYRPGETIRFRSLTLDRGTFLPPEKELHLQFRLRNPDGALISLAEGNGRLVHNLEPVLGPDRKPIRGIGTGEHELEPDAPPGEYTLEVVEGGPANETVLDSRKFQVAAYVVDEFEKKLEFDGRSYGAGDVVQARIEVRRAAGALLRDTRADVVARLGEAAPFHDEKGVRLEVLPNPPAKESKAAAHTVRFRLPADLFANRNENAEPGGPTLSITIRDGVNTETIVRPIPIVYKSLNVEFFPEGGDLVAGVPGRVYFEVRTPAGKPADLKGFVTDGRNTVAEVATLTDADQPGVNRGQGVFTFTPQPGKKYFLVPRTPEGIDPPTKDGYPLPAAKPDGVVLTALEPVTDKGGAIRVQVQSKTGPKTLHVGAYARGRLIAHERVEVQAGEPAEVKLAGDPGPGGVTRVTVFEEPKAAATPADLIPRAERLVYRRPTEQLAIKVRPDKEKYAPADRVALELTATDETGRPKPAVLLVAVVSRGVLAMADDRTDRLLPTHFLLAGDLRHPEELEHADFLLTDHPKAAVALDLLLGTQGWRRFAEQNVAPAAAFRDDVERMLVAHGRRASAPVTLFRMEVQRLAAQFLPRLEETGLQVVDAEAAFREHERTVEPLLEAQVTGAQMQLDGAEKQYRMSAAELYKFESRGDDPQNWALPALLIGLLALAAGGLAFRPRLPAGERSRLAWGTAAALAAAAFVLGGIFLTAGTPETEWARRVELQNQSRTFTPATPTPSPKLPPPIVRKERGKDDKQPARAKTDSRRIGPPPSIPDAPGLIRLVGPMPPAGTAKKAGRDIDRERLEKLGRLQGAVPKNLLDPPPAAGQLPDPGVMPFVVREYGHRRGPAAGDAGADRTETVYWHPVLVLPDHGRTTVEFQLSEAQAGYRVLVAGHTADGRIGAVTRTIEARPAAGGKAAPARVIPDENMARE